MRQWISLIEDAARPVKINWVRPTPAKEHNEVEYQLHNDASIPA